MGTTDREAHLNDISLELAEVVQEIQALVDEPTRVFLLSDPEVLSHGPSIVAAGRRFVDSFPSLDTRSRVAAFTVEGRTPRQIADLLGVSTQAVYQHLKRVGQ